MGVVKVCIFSFRMVDGRAQGGAMGWLGKSAKTVYTDVIVYVCHSMQWSCVRVSNGLTV